MTIEQRIARLENAKKAEQDQRDWLLSVDWSGDGSTAQEAAGHHDRVIATYDSLIEKLKARL